MTVEKEKIKDLPNLTEEELKIIDFWRIRGYDEITHILGMNVHLRHSNPRYWELGLDLIYLKQFLEEHDRLLVSRLKEMFSEFLDEEVDDFITGVQWSDSEWREIKQGFLKKIDSVFSEVGGK